MNRGTLLSRRIALGGLVASTAFTIKSLPADARHPDAQLIALGRKFEQLAAQIDQIISSRSNLDDNFAEEFDRVESEILTSHATTVQGLRVKARAAC